MDDRLSHTLPVMLTPLDARWTDEECDLYNHYKPYGFILFGKHCETPEQVQKLCADIRQTCGEDTVIAIDQEGGRVARMRAPHWPEFPAAASMDDVRQTYYQIGTMLKSCGITMDFAPCLDVVPEGGRCDAIGDRCFSSDPEVAGQKGIDACQGLLDAGIISVVKHMPGHGRAQEDSHFYLPFVDASEEDLKDDLKPFQMVAQWDKSAQVAGMTAHILFNVWNEYKPATLSDKTIKDIIRGKIDFHGLLFSDDLTMKALDRFGDIPTRVKLSLEAGCDVALPCHTDLATSRAILESLANDR